MEVHVAVPSEDPQRATTSSTRGSDPPLVRCTPCHNWLQKAWGRKALLRKHPHVLVVPLLVLAGLLCAGIFGVKYGIASAYDRARQAASYSGARAVDVLEADIKRAALPVKQMARAVALKPNIADVFTLWSTYAPVFWESTADGAGTIALSPQGVFSAVYPPVSANFNASYTAIPIGYDVLADYSLAKSQALQAIAMRTPAIYGPEFLFDESWITIANPIFLANKTARELWGMVKNPSNCPANLCYDAASKTKFWGFAFMNMRCRLLLWDGPAFADLQNDGYKVQLWKYPYAFLNETKKSLITPNNHTAEMQQPEDALCFDTNLMNVQWQLCVWRDVWVPAYLRWMYPVVVVGSVLVSLLLFGILLSWAEYRTLLHSLVPKETIQRIRDEDRWASMVMCGETVVQSIKFETPAQHMLSVVSCCLEGNLPPIPTLLAVQDALHRSADIYRPSAEAMDSHIKGALNLDNGVRNYLMAQLLDQDRGFMRRDSASFLNSATPPPAPPTHKRQVDGKPPQSPPGRGSLDWIMRKPAELPVSRFSECGRQPSKLRPGGGRARSQLGADPRENHADSGSIPAAIDQSAENLVTLNPLCAAVDATDLFALPAWSDVMTVPVVPTTVQEALSIIMSRPCHQKATLEHHTAAGADVRSSPVAVEHCHTDVVDRPSHPAPPLLTEVESLLAHADTWNLDPYALARATDNHALSVISYWLLHTSHLIDTLQLDRGKLVCFLQRVEAGYNPRNRYHNATHAACVLQQIHVIMTRGGMMGGYVDTTLHFSAYLAAMVHDFEHVGKNNDYLVNTHDDLAVRYNDRSPMENHHLAATFTLLKRPEFNFMSRMPRSQWRRIRKNVIDLVLATDMKQHFAVLGQFQALHGTGPSSLVKNSSRSCVCWKHDRVSKHDRASKHDRVSVHWLAWLCRDSATSDVASVDDGLACPDVIAVSDNDKSLCLQMALKVADLAHMAAHLEIHKRWVDDLQEEFFMQGDAERSAGLPISPLCDREKQGVLHSSQVAFIQFVVLPLFQAFTSRFSRCMPLLRGLLSNNRYWEALASPQEQRNSSTDRRSADRKSGSEKKPATVDLTSSARTSGTCAVPTSSR